MVEENKDKLPDTLRGLARYSHLGITFAATILLCLFGGQYLDKKLGTEPYLTLTGAFLGSAGGFYYIIKSVTEGQEDNNEKKKDKTKKH